ncbi:MAG: hypothetical protein RBS68_15890 [Anaerolineales bacterium]|jgi:hypothetical protein|nr:hypothetical protein [Anaerolineales bacterium]
MNATRFEEYKDFRKARAARKAHQKAALRAEVKAARKAGGLPSMAKKKPLKEIVSDFAYEF